MLAVWAPAVILLKFVVHHSAHGSTKVELGWHRDDFVSFLFLLLYSALACYLGNGRSPGKRIAKTRVISLTHSRMGLWQSFERALGYGASFAEAGFGFLQFFLHRNRQTVHDRIAETIVVDERNRE